MKNLLSQTQSGLQIAPEGGFKGFGKLGLEGSLASNATLTFSGFISSVIGLLTIIAIIWFVFIFITGAIAYMSSGGDKASIEGARKKIVNGITGLVLVIIAIFVIRLIGYLLGVPDILNFVSLFGQVAGLIVNP
jgi:hypothetical protein